MALQWYKIPKQCRALLELHITQRQLESPGRQKAAHSWRYGIKRCVTALPHVRKACLFLLKTTGIFSSWQMINRLVARFLTSEKDLFRPMNVWAKGPLLVRLLGDLLNGLNDPRLETIAWNAAVQYHPTQSLLCLSNTYHRQPSIRSWSV